MDTGSARLRRGQISMDEYQSLENFNDQELMVLLKSDQPGQRTAAARILGARHSIQAAQPLCDLLSSETALYTRIAVSEALGEIGSPALPFLVPLLGIIGQNQHQQHPVRGFYKKSFPLPRDIAARTITKIGPPALTELHTLLLYGERKSILESLDAIGFIAFYSGSRKSTPQLLELYQQSQADPLMVWKIIRALQSFPDSEVVEVLAKVIITSLIPEHRWEAVRSLGQLHLSIPEELVEQATHDPNSEVRAMCKLFLKR